MERGSRKVFIGELPPIPIKGNLNTTVFNILNITKQLSLIIPPLGG